MTNVYAYAYQRIADDLRDRILSNDLKPGTQLPTEAALRERYRVSRSTVTQALRALRTEGLVECRFGHGIYVRRVPDGVETVPLEPGDTAQSRMPIPDERIDLQLGEGVPVLVITRRSGTVQVYAGDRTQVRSR
ncbi:MAG TPA: winged helix-turn-helix domain-containing protein [Rugosimonospora sp.]|nr:winged helix-turn-helix domain-containing protein [Rugosimonospora sp.]